MKIILSIMFLLLFISIFFTEKTMGLISNFIIILIICLLLFFLSLKKKNDTVKDERVIRFFKNILLIYLSIAFLVLFISINCSAILGINYLAIKWFAFYFSLIFVGLSFSTLLVEFF